MNTVLGMGTVFVVLIFISFIISLFKYISYLRTVAKKERKKTQEAADNATAQIALLQQKMMRTILNLAVITAAIAASEGTSTDGLLYQARQLERLINRRKL